ncbi:tetratricopeptide repeat protein, partial [Bacteroidota bacterium]
TVAVCEKYNDEPIKEKANGNIATLFSMKGSSAYKSKEYDMAIELFDKALEKSPDDTRALFGKGLVLRKQKKTDEMIVVLEKTIEVGEENDKSVINAKKLLAGHYSIEGAKKIKSKAYSEALSLQEKALSLDETYANAYYYSAVIYNLQNEWDQAIEAANKGLENENGDDNKKAKFYMELGNAYKGKGNKDEACKAYTNASFDDFTEQAKQMKTELKCE